LQVMKGPSEMDKWMDGWMDKWIAARERVRKT